MRAFVCVDVTDAAVLAAVDGVQRRLRDEAGARPVGPAPIHFTLTFLGDVPDEEGGGRISAALASIRFKAFNAVVVGVGAFPSARRPRAVWVGADAEEGGRGLAGLAASVAGALGPLGPAAGKAGGGGGGRPFRPHATICRMAGARDGAQEKAAAAAPIIESLRSERFGTQRVGSFKLKKSVLSPGGAVHTDVSEVVAEP